MALSPTPDPSLAPFVFEIMLTWFFKLMLSAFQLDSSASGCRCGWVCHSRNVEPLINPHKLMELLTCNLGYASLRDGVALGRFYLDTDTDGVDAEVRLLSLSLCVATSP